MTHCMLRQQPIVGRSHSEHSQTHCPAGFPDADLARRGYCLTVSVATPLNVPTAAAASGWALLLVLHLPLDSFGRSAVKRTVTTPLPLDPANFPVLAAPSTVNGTTVEYSNRHVVVDSSFWLFTTEPLTTATRFPAFVGNVWCWPFFVPLPDSVWVPVVATGPLNVRANVELLATAALPVTVPLNVSAPLVAVCLACFQSVRLWQLLQSGPIYPLWMSSWQVTQPCDRPIN